MNSPASPTLEALAIASASSSVLNLQVRNKTSDWSTNICSTWTQRAHSFFLWIYTGVIQNRLLVQLNSRQNQSETHEDCRAYGPDDGQQRAERLLLHAEHLCGDVGEQRGLHERPVQTLPALQNLRSSRHCVWYLVGHLQTHESSAVRPPFKKNSLQMRFWCGAFK